MTRNKILALGFVVILLVGIPLTLYTVQQQQESRTQAQLATNLSFTPNSTATSPIQTAIGQTVSLDVMVDPGTNIVSFIKLEIQYDETKLATAEATTTGESAFEVNEDALPLVVDGPIFTPGKIEATLSTGTDPTQAIQTLTRAVTISFRALAETGDTPTNVTYGNTTEILSIGGNDQASENVLLGVNPAFIAIAADGSGITPSPTGGGGVPTPTTGTALTPIPTVPSGTNPTQPPQATNQLPVCSAFNIDRETTGAAPYSVTFTAVGTDADGTITKATFNYGDGPVETVTETGGIGTNSVNVQRAHTYNNPGTYQATALMTDNQNGVSNQTSCQTTIVVLAPTSGANGGGTDTGLSPFPSATMADPGPGDVFIGLGALAAVFVLVGGFIFFAL